MDTTTQQPSAQDSPDTTKLQGRDQDHPSRVIIHYLLERSADFRELNVLREAGWNSPAGDTFFKRQREVSDKSDERTATHFYFLMQKIGCEIQSATRAFDIIRQRSAEQSGILDMCMAPGGFLATALYQNPSASTLAFSLPISSGGHKVLLPQRSNVEQRFIDITMLLADMSTQSSDADNDSISISIPLDHPDYSNFVHERQIPPDRLFDLILCDGQVLRTQTRAPYREAREARRLISVQLAIGLEHLRPGGTMVILMHRLEAWDSVELLYNFHQFSTVRLYKPKAGHRTRSSFYMIASAVQSQHPEAVRAIARWKELWRIATFGSDDECQEVFGDREIGVDQMLEQFGNKLVSLGRDIWRTQTNALARAPYIPRQAAHAGQMERWKTRVR